MIDLSACDVVFISYDEPNAEAHFEALLAQIPRAKRVQGVEGFDAAHRQVGEVATSDHVVTVDADNRLLDPAFLSARFDIAPRDRVRVFSFSARNAVNGLSYGNGGVKIWPRATLRTLQTHENAGREDAALDFCWTVPYFQVNRLLSEVHPNGSPYQAFRAGFREGVKLNFADGKRAYDVHPDLPPELALPTHIGVRNLERLKVWCTVGRDAPQGDWAIFGARLGCAEAVLGEFAADHVSDYAWFDRFWAEKIEPKYAEADAREARSAALLQDLNDALALDLTDLTPEASVAFKARYKGFRAYGSMRVV